MNQDDIIKNLVRLLDLSVEEIWEWYGYSNDVTDEIEEFIKSNGLRDYVNNLK